MDAAALAAAVGPLPEPAGRVRVLSAGGGDAAVAAEAAFVAQVSGTEVVRVDDLARQPRCARCWPTVAARRRRLPDRRRRLDASLAGDGRRDDRRAGRRGAHVGRAARRPRRPRRAADDAELGRARASR